MGRSSLTIKKFLFLIPTTKMRAKSSGSCRLRLAAHRLDISPSIVLQHLSLNRSLKPTMSSILPWTPMMRPQLYRERLRSVKQPMQNCPRHLRQSRSGRKVGPILIAIFRREVQQEQTIPHYTHYHHVPLPLVLLCTILLRIRGAPVWLLPSLLTLFGAQQTRHCRHYQTYRLEQMDIGHNSYSTFALIFYTTY